MGVHKNISYSDFPRQSNYVGQKVSVCFNYDTTKKIEGIILRDDLDEPFEMLIQLEDKRVVRAVECHYTLLNFGNNGKGFPPVE